ncbi:MAG: universal stress protein [Pseudomonadales bacterium]|nr:universal stress protein [Pseudomonadales bacterium]
MIKSILVIADCAAGNLTALAKAKELANPFNANILVVRFINTTPGADVADTMKAAEQALITDLAMVFTDNKPQHEVVVTPDITAWTKQSCQQNGFDLVIKTGHRSERSFYTPTDWHLIRQLPCPVLIASDSKWRAKPVVLATVDLEDKSAPQQSLNNKAVTQAAEMAIARNAKLAVAYSLPIPKALLELDIIEKESYARKHEQKLQKKMQEFLDAVEVMNAEIFIKSGPAEKSLPSLANKIKADLVVVGSVGRQGLKGALLGNTAEKILHHLRTDILVVKP